MDEGKKLETGWKNPHEYLYLEVECDFDGEIPLAVRDLIRDWRRLRKIADDVICEVSGEVGFHTECPCCVSEWTPVDPKDREGAGTLTHDAGCSVKRLIDWREKQSVFLHEKFFSKVDEAP